MDLTGSWTYIQDVARSRLGHNKTSHHIYEFGDSLEVLGAAGELVARRYLGIDEKLHLGFDGGCDLRFAGLRVDVKATVLTPNVIFRFLQWPKEKVIKSDIIFLTAIDPITRQGVPLGYATKEEILKSPVARERLTPCYEIPVRSLHNPFDLVAKHLRTRENSR
jgi:hypothetical protein